MPRVYTTQRIALTCQQCLNLFEVPPCRVKDGAKYCSPACSGAAKTARFARPIDTSVHYCECGCGQQTTPVKETNRKRGIYAGQHPRVIKGHAISTIGPVEERFWARVARSDGCWLWTGDLNGNGYGVLYMGGGHKARKFKMAHRISFELANGVTLNSSQHVCHHCDNPLCVRPDHLFVGTHADNLSDAAKKLRFPQAKLNPEKVREIRRLLASGVRSVRIAERFNVSRACIYRIKKGHWWKHVQEQTSHASSNDSRGL